MTTDDLAARGRDRLWWAAPAAIVVLSGLLHLLAGYTLPHPWPDEAHFITPALTLAREGRLAVPELNAPDGIFWMPTGYYVLQVPLLLLRADPLAAARWLSWVGVVLFGGAVAQVAVRAGANRWIATGAVVVWAVMPRVVAIANIARMEGIVLGLAGVCLLLVARGRWYAALAIAAAAPLVHPIGVVIAVAVAASLIVWRPGRPSRADLLLIALVAVAWVAEAVYFAAHADIAADHLRFQFTRKSGRAIVVRWWQWLLLAISAGGGLAATLRWRTATATQTAAWIALALVGAFVLVDIVGREMWYEPLGRETVVLLLGLVAAAAARHVPASTGTRYAMAVVTATAVAAAGVLVVRTTLTSGWYGMRPNLVTRGEWQDFTAAAVGELQRLDAAAGGEQVVVVDPLSGFGQEVVARPWTRLTFVQPTPATPLDTTGADYVLATPGAPFVTKQLVEQWGVVPPALEVRSGRGTFTLHLLENPNRSGG